ncbi:MAG: hypothetical protein LC785_16930 [Acidobacteria bacterium]|nr:hypothetical protein [Acidobacteriota bacterium]MCA1643585.1 hypothetical protein [Acidobacteriota bacterium]
MGDREEKDRSGAAGTPREQEATSSETLDDIDRTEDATVKSPGDSATGQPGGGTSAPSPDGAFDGERGGGRADGSEAGEPM